MRTWRRARVTVFGADLTAGDRGDVLRVAGVGRVFEATELLNEAPRGRASKNMAGDLRSIVRSGFDDRDGRVAAAWVR